MLEHKSGDCRPLRTRLAMGLGLAGMMTLAGCFGPREVKPSGNADDAQKLLSTALDAWQSGQSPQQLKSGKPVVYVADEDWEAGKALQAYLSPEPPIRRGGHWQVSTVLTLADSGQKTVAYAITTEPAITIIRAEEHN